ncbi:PREDICTED: pentatricopeptide repeat-containing protein At5g15280 isoform X2 [Tarenaya hassleriana]|uniref:pentatricopeptide repeat-containing protein At5g15280 isoform X2 n=1 Tax=Tarenaya hassleriana TaxID=28532 RepID=UPI00053C0F30|nr:PREDICTED: pentatricopeptide repeat-containing protein At5g15280 isoform X2 [Tarenaya hassleriana]
MPNLLSIGETGRLRFVSLVRCVSTASLSSNSVAASPPSTGDPTIQTHVESSPFSIRKWDYTDRNSNLLGVGVKENLRASGSSLKDLLLGVSDVVPYVSRRFRRFPGLESENVLELLLDFESECRKGGIGGKKVEALWEVFRWAGGQYKGFKHLRQSCEIMASMLLREGMVKEVELLLMEMESRGDTLDNKEIFSELIQKYVAALDSEKAVLLFDWMRCRDLVPSTSCYQALIDHLVRAQKTEPAFRICLDWVEATAESNNLTVHEIGKVIELLCLDQRIQEARSLVRKLLALGCKLSRIIHVLCRKFGAETANAYMEELEDLGFKPDEATIGILIVWSCCERNIRRAFLHLSEIVSKGLEPNVYSYNAILGELFRTGLWEHARHILDEMKDSGIDPTMSTFEIMLAGYFKARRFEEAKMIVHEMLHYGLVEASAVEDPLSQAFILLGFDPLAVRLKRDNDAGLSKTEFLDDLGNGLYLDTDTGAYEQRVKMVLESSMLPNFNLLIIRACDHGNLGTILELVDEMVRWGQELSLRCFTALVKCLCASRSHVRVSASLLKKWPKLANQLNGETLNFLVQEYCKKGFTDQGKLIFDRMVQMHLPTDEMTYTLLIKGLCKKGTVHDLRNLWDIACKDNWVPNLDGCRGLWECLIHKEMVKEALQLFDSVLMSYHHSQPEACKIFIEKLCNNGFSRIAHSVVKRLVKGGYILEDEVYGHLITGLCKDNNVSAAYAVLSDLLDKNFVPGLDDSLMLIPLLCRANKICEAIALADLCLKSYPTDSFYVHRALTEGLCLAGKIADAENQFRIMLSDGFVPDDILRLMFQGYCKANNSRKVQEVLGSFVRKNLSISVAGYREYVRSMCSERRFFNAISLKEFLLGERHHSGLVIYNLLIFYLFQSKNCSLANQILQEMQGKGLLPDESTYNFLVYGLFICKDFSSSLQYLSSMISKGLRPNNRSLRVVVSSLCDNREVDEALELSQVMESRGWTHGSVILTKIGEALISSGKIQEAEFFLTRVTSNGITHKQVNYDKLIKKLSLSGRLDTAVHLLNMMLKKGTVPDCSSFDSVINGFLKCNDLEKAMDFQTEMLDRGLKTRIITWNVLVHKLCESGQAGKAERLLKSMVESGENPAKEMYEAVIERYRVENDTVKVSEIMQLMQQSGYQPDFESHWSLISNMNASMEKAASTGQGFLSRLLSGSGFSWKTQKFRG